MIEIKDNQYNIGYLCTTRQCEEGRANKTAMRWIDSAMQKTDYTFTDLDLESNRFANVLKNLGLQKGDIFCTFLPKCPEQFFSFLGILKMEVIACPLFSSFGEESLFDRMGDSQAKGVITKKSLHKKILKIKDRLPNLRYIILVDADSHVSDIVLSYSTLMKEASGVFITPVTSPETPSTLHYTSGSTGLPKGALHLHKSILMHSYTSENILQLNENERYWCISDQGWVTGITYGMTGPWSLGVTQLHYAGGYEMDAWMSILENEKISVWYTSPTALRMMMREDKEVFLRHDLSKLKYIFSVGEYLDPGIVKWSRDTLKKEIYETYFQTETGCIMISTKPGMPVIPGSMGKPVDRIDAAILSDEGKILGKNQKGNLCIKAGWDSMMNTYLNHDDVYKKRFRNGFYFTNDLAYSDNEGYYWFEGRCDDVINTAGHLIHPFEIENALLKIPEIAEAGVIGAPDEMLFEKVAAYIVLNENCEWNDDLELKIRLNLTNKLSSIATPQNIFVMKELPKDTDGKINRSLLKEKFRSENS